MTFRKKSEEPNQKEFMRAASGVSPFIRQLSRRNQRMPMTPLSLFFEVEKRKKRPFLLPLLSCTLGTILGYRFIASKEYSYASIYLTHPAHAWSYWLR
jgi:hypothetical protein